MFQIKPPKLVLFSVTFKRLYSLKGVFVDTFKRLHALKVIFVVAFMSLVFASIYLCYWGHSTAYAATADSTINFQARLMSSAGAIVPDGCYNVQFKLYSAATGGSALWTDSYTYASTTAGINGTCLAAGASSDDRLQVINGYVTVPLGSLTAFPATINWNQPLWLTLNIGGTSGSSVSYDGEMAPRLQLTAVPYAFQSGALASTTNSGGFNSTLTLPQPGSGVSSNETFTIPDQGAGGAYTLLVAAAGTTPYIVNGTSLQSSSNFNISGTGQAGTGFLSPSLDALSGGNLTIGGTNAGTITVGSTSGTSITLGRSTVTNTISVGSAIGASNTQTIGIGTSGTGTTAITIGSTTAGSTTAIQGGGSVSINSGGFAIALPAAAGTVCLQSSVNCGFAPITGGTGYVQNGTSLQSSSNFNISGTGQAGTGFLSPSLDALSGGTLTIGGTNATSITLAKAGVTTNLNGGVIFVPSTGFSSGTNLATVTASLLTNNSAVPVTATASGLQFNMPTTGIGSAGRIVYITNAGSNSFLLNIGPYTMTFQTTSTATLYWNGTAWSSAGLDAGVTLLGTVDSVGTPNGNGATIANNTLYLQSASASYPGLVNISTQSFAGQKTFDSLLIGAAGETVSGGAISLTGNVASSLTTSAGALTITSAAAATFSTTAGGLTLQAGSGAVSLGTSTSLTASGALGITSGGATALTLDAGGAAALNLGTSNATGITIGSTSEGGTITLGRSTVTNTISVGSAIGASNTQTIGIGTSGTGTTAITIGSTTAGSTTAIQGGGSVSIQTTSSGTINIGTNTASSTTQNVNIGTSTSGTSNVTIGSVSSSSGTTIQGGASSGINLNTSGSAISISAVAEWDNGGTNLATLSVSPSTIGDVMMVTVGITSTTDSVQSITGGGVANWHYVIAHNSTNATEREELWEGTVTTAGSSTITVTYVSTPGVGCEIVAQEFTAGLGVTTNWSVTTGGYDDTASSATVTFPSLTAAQSGEMYWGYNYLSASQSSGSTPGFTYLLTSFDNIIAYDTNTTANTNYNPTYSMTSAASSTGLAVIVGVSRGAGGATIINGSNATNAFEVQNSGNSSIFDVNTGAGEIVLGSGSTGEANPVLLVVDSSTSSSDPTTEVNGAIYYNASANTFRCGQGSVWLSCLAPNNASVANQTVTTTTAAYLNGSAITIPPGGLHAGAQFIWRVALTKSASGTAQPVFVVKYGTHGSTADTSEISFTGPVETGVTDTGIVYIYVTVQSVNSSTGTWAGTMTLTHNLTTTGFSTGGQDFVAQTTTSGFNDTISAGIVGLTVTAGTSNTFTVEQVQTQTAGL